MRGSSLILLALLAGCQTCPDVVPEKVYITVEKMVPVPAELAKDCDLPAKRGNTYGEAIRLANARKAALEECNARMRQIRGLR